MLLKIYLGISILTLICSVLTNFSTMQRVRNKYKEKLDTIETKTDLVGSILSWLKIVIISFIPIYHILMLIVIVFMGDKITTRSDEIVENALRNADKKENNKNR